MRLCLTHAGDVQNRPASRFHAICNQRTAAAPPTASAHISAVVVRDVSEDSGMFAVMRMRAFYAPALRRMRGHP